MVEVVCLCVCRSCVAVVAGLCVFGWSMQESPCMSRSVEGITGDV